MRIVPVPCLKDNYAYLVIDDAQRKAAVVDPGEAAPVLEAADREGVRIEQVWATHHHADHVGGVAKLAAALDGLEVFAHPTDAAKFAGTTRTLADGDVVELDGIRARAIHNPGHTLGAISFYIEDCGAEAGAVFTGDTLFSAGCGRLFEGDAEMMHASLVRLASLPPDVRVFFGHEYTESNLRFAAAVDPHDHAVASRAKDVAALRARGDYSTPSTIAIERATNPFVRASDAATFADLRKRKDSFK
jgi:hydroxyacylglutathione hydrolase